MSAGGGGGNSPTTGNAPTSTGNAGNQPAATPGIGTPVRDGQFQFVVTSVTYAKSVGGQFGETAQGHFALLHVTIKNIGSQSQTMDDTSQYVFANGHKYSANSVAGIDANGTSNSVFLNDINPGNSVHGILVFDMPTNIKPVMAELHDSPTA